MLAGDKGGGTRAQRSFPATQSGDRSQRIVFAAQRKAMKKTLVVDIGGTHVKLLMEGVDQRQFDSGPKMPPAEFVDRLKQTTRDWKFDVISIGFPSVVRGGKICKEPKHLGQGWVGF